MGSILLILQDKIPLLTLVIRGGWLMLPIILISIIGLAIVLDRWHILRQVSKKCEKDVLIIDSLLKNNKFQEAYKYCQDNQSPINEITKTALKSSNRSFTEIKSNIESVGRLESTKLEKNLNILYSLSTVAPLLGFLGTVTGMVKAFQKIEALGGSVNATVLAGGIWEALITTVGGLFVGIPLLLAYSLILGKADGLVLKLEEDSIAIYEQIIEKRK